MKSRGLVSIAALLVAFIVVGAMPYAQNQSVEIGFPFVAGGKEMAAGKYTAVVSTAGVILRGPGASVTLPVVTWLGRHDRDADPEFVFDKLDGKFVLSELWIPGEDGLLLLATKVPHQHAVVGGSNPRK